MAVRTFFPNDRVLLVVGVVGVPEAAVRPELKLQVLVAEAALVANAARRPPTTLDAPRALRCAARRRCLADGSVRSPY